MEEWLFFLYINSKYGVALGLIIALVSLLVHVGSCVGAVVYYGSQ